MHALPLLAALVDPYEILFRRVALRPHSQLRFGDEPNPEARLLVANARCRSWTPTRPSRFLCLSQVLIAKPRNTFADPAWTARHGKVGLPDSESGSPHSILLA
jgi:hypothetical protein